MQYIINEPTTAKAIADLREAVGWNRMESAYYNQCLNSFYHIAVFDNDFLDGYIDCVSNGVTDAYNRI